MNPRIRNRTKARRGASFINSFGVDVFFHVRIVHIDPHTLQESIEKEDSAKNENNKGRKEKPSAQKVSVSNGKFCLQQIAKYLCIRYAVSIGLKANICTRMKTWNFFMTKNMLSCC